MRPDLGPKVAEGLMAAAAVGLVVVVEEGAGDIDLAQYIADHSPGD